MVDATNICAIMNSKLKKRSGAETDELGNLYRK